MVRPAAALGPLSIHRCDRQNQYLSKIIVLHAEDSDAASFRLLPGTKKESRKTLVYVRRDAGASGPKSEAWRDVPIAKVSGEESGQRVRAQVEQDILKPRTRVGSSKEGPDRTGD